MGAMEQFFLPLEEGGVAERGELTLSRISQFHKSQLGILPSHKKRGIPYAGSTAVLLVLKN